MTLEVIYPPIVIGSVIGVAVCRSVRIYRNEEQKKPLKRWQIRLLAALVGGTTTYVSETLFYSMEPLKALAVAIATGIAIPFAWKLTVAFLQKQFPALKETLHPTLVYKETK